MKAILKYPGAKWRLSDWITSLFPTHKIYLEPFCGSGAIFFNKAPAEYETINDIDGQIINFFEVCRDYPEELARLIYFTPWSRGEYESIQEDRAGTGIKLIGNKIEDARRFCIRCNMGFGSKLADRAGWKNSTKCNRGAVNPKTWGGIPEIILQAAERLKQAQIECRPYHELIPKYNTKDCLIYADPPYLLNTRNSRLYAHEMGREAEHIQLIEILKAHKGLVVLSGYENDLYSEMFKGWIKLEYDTHTFSGAGRKEILWLNYEPDNQLNLFEGLEVRQ